MKIGIVLSQPPGYSETFFNSKIEGLQKSGFDVTLFCQNNNSGFKACKVEVFSKTNANPILQTLLFCKVYLSLIPNLKKIYNWYQIEKSEGVGILVFLKKVYINAPILKSDLDYLHFGFVTLALSRETISKAIGAKMAVSFRGFDIAVYPLKNPGCYSKVWKYVDKVHTISNNLLKLARNHGLPENVPFKKITPAIDVNLFKYTKLDFNSNKSLVFITTGRLHWIKGIVETIEALAILKDEGLDFTYKIIGEGADYERIAFAAYQLGLKENVQLLGKLSHSEVKQELEKASIYIQYSIHEGFCNAVLEAQAMGKLCIVRDAGGLPENVLHEKTGWVVPKYDVELLATTISKVLALSLEEKIIIAKTAQNRVKDEFNIEKQQSEFISFYKQLEAH